MRFKHKYYIFIYFLFLSFSCFSQKMGGGDDLDILVNRYKNFFSHSQEIVQELNKDSSVGIENVWRELAYEDLVKQGNEGMPYSNHDQKINFADFGLRWYSNANYNFEPGFIDAENLFSKYHLSTGIDWVIMGEGSWLKHKKDLKLFKLQGKRDSLLNHIKYNRTSLDVKLTIIRNVFDLERIEILKIYRQLMSELVSLNEVMFEKNLIHSSERIKDSLKLEELNQAIDFYSDYLVFNDNLIIEKYRSLPNSFEDLPNWKDIKDEDLLKNEEELVEIEKSILKSNKRDSDRPSLRARIRYNYYGFEDHNPRSFGSVGLTFSLPLGAVKDNSLIELQKADYDRDLEFQRSKLKGELLNHHRNFYTLKNELEVLKNEGLYISALMDKELEIFQENTNTFSPKKYIIYTWRLLENKLALLDIKQSLCEEFIIFYELSGYLPDFMEEQPIERTKTTYLWKKDFYTNSNEDIINLLKKSEINKVLISPGDSIRKERSFIDLAKQEGIDVARLISENSYIASHEGVGKFSVKLEGLKNSTYSEIHLNIEPHSLADYNRNKTIYINRLNEIYNLAYLWCIENGKKLSVSIPMHLPEENAMILSKYNIESYIMAYESKDIEKLLERTKMLRTYLGDNYVWVLKVEDYTDIYDLETAVNALIIFGVKNIAYYDFRSKVIYSEYED